MHPRERAELVAALAQRVRVRFALTAEDFVDRLPAAAGRDASSEPDPLAPWSRLALDDLYLATACAQGDERAWHELTATHLDFLRRFARRFLPELSAVDIVDQVIADLWNRRKIASYTGRSSLRTWLAAVVAHASINAGKAVRRQMALESADAGAVRDAQFDAESARVVGRLVRGALEGQPNEVRVLLYLHYEQGLTLDEMVGVLGTSKATLSRRLQAARADLRRTIDATATSSLRTSTDRLLAGVDLGAVELDLGAILALPSPPKRKPGDVV